MATEPYTLYSPAIPRETNEFIPAKELKDRLIEFYTLYKPENTKGGQIEEYLKYARGKGVLALRTVLRQKYGCNLDEADSSEVGWLRVRTKLEEFYSYHVGDKSQEDIQRIFTFAQEKGLLALDTKLKEKYGQSLSDFTSRGLHLWKANWKSVLQEHHAESVTYELKRFYTVVERMPQQFGQTQTLDKLVDWAVRHTRTEVNEKLLKKYKFCLDDVKMVKGNTNEERKVNLKAQLIDFYQKNDPSKLGPDATRGSGKIHSINSKNNGNMSRESSSRSSFVTGQGRLEEKEKISKEMLEIDYDAEIGIIKLEALNDKLIKEYGKGLEDKNTEEIRNRLVEFYRRQRVQKSMQSIEEIVNYAQTKGLDAMNEKLVLTYGQGIVIDDL